MLGIAIEYIPTAGASSITPSTPRIVTDRLQVLAVVSIYFATFL